MSRRTEPYRIMPWVGGINTSVDPGVLNPQELVQADNVQFSSTGARIKREALEYLDSDLAMPDFRSSSGLTRTLRWTSNVLRSTVSLDERLVVGEHINVTGSSDYIALDTPILTRTSGAEVTTVTTIGDTAGSLAGKYFLISAGDPGEDFYVWYNVSGSGTDPELVNKTGIEVAIATNNSASTVAAATQTVLQAHADFNATVLSNVITVTAALAGYVVAPGAGNSGFAVSVTTEGFYAITYEGQSSVSESETAIGSVVLERASNVIMVKDYWRWTGVINEQILVFATDNFQLFTLDDSGHRAQVHGQEQITAVVATAASTLTTGDYFLLNGANDENNAYVWYNKNAGGGDPAIAGRTGIEVVIATGNTAAQVATATAAAIDATAAFEAEADTTTVAIMNATAGVTTAAVDVNTGFAITVAAYGATAPGQAIDRIRTNVFNEDLQIYFSGLGNYPVMYNPDDNEKYQLMVANPSTGLLMPDASWAFNHLGRVFTNDKNNRDLIHYSETFDPAVWLGFGDSGALPIFIGDGDPEGLTNGYVYKGFAVVAKKDSRFRIVGDSPENFIVERVSSGMGNEGPLSIPVDETDVVFISRRGIHSQQATDAYGDTDAAYLSSDIKPTFSDFEPLRLIDVQGAYIPDMNSIALSIAEDGAVEPNDVWLYNFEIQVPGKERPGAWYRWPDISCTALGRRLVGGKYKLVFGTENGRVTQAQVSNEFADFGTTGIPFRIKTGAIYPGNDPQSMKAFKKISMIYRPQGNFSFLVTAKIDNHQAQGFSFDQISGLDLLGETFILGESLLGASNTLAPFTFTMDGYGRGVTLTVTQPTADEQVEIWGFIIEYENVDLEQEVQ